MRRRTEAPGATSCHWSERWCRCCGYELHSINKAWKRCATHCRHGKPFTEPWRWRWHRGTMLPPQKARKLVTDQQMRHHVMLSPILMQRGTDCLACPAVGPLRPSSPPVVAPAAVSGRHWCGWLRSEPGQQRGNHRCASWLRRAPAAATAAALPPPSSGNHGKRNQGWPQQLQCTAAAQHKNLTQSWHCVRLQGPAASCSPASGWGGTKCWACWGAAATLSPTA